MQQEFWNQITNDAKILVFPEFMESDEDFTQTEIHLASTQEVTWTVRNLRPFLSRLHYSMDSPSFVFQNATWCLRMYPDHYESLSHYIGLNIVRLNSSVPRHRLLYHLMHADSVKGTCLKAADFDETHTVKGDKKFIKHEELAEKSKDILRVIFKVSCYKIHDVSAVSQSKLLIQDTKDFGALCQGFKNVLLNGQNHDVILKVQETEFRAHQDILRARSSVLKPMLTHDMLKKSSGVIDIPDCDPDAFKQFLLYLYSGQVEKMDTANMLSLYYIADKYAMGHLKEVCREFIKKSLTCANVSNVSELALTHRDALLLESATEFFVRERCSVVRTVEWQRFLKRNPIQANELIIKVFDSSLLAELT